MASAARSFRLEGLDDMDRRLELLGSKSAKAVVRSGMNAGLTVMSKAIKKQIASEPGISPELKSSLKSTVNKRFKKRKRDDALEAKAGMSVGKRKPIKRSGKHSKSGVGIGTPNVHWFALGTKLRRVKKTGAEVGRITQVAVVRKAMASRGSGGALRALRSAAEKKLDSEVNKLRNTV